MLLLSVNGTPPPPFPHAIYIHVSSLLRVLPVQLSGLLRLPPVELVARAAGVLRVRLGVGGVVVIKRHSFLYIIMPAVSLPLYQEHRHPNDLAPSISHYIKMCGTCLPLAFSHARPRSLCVFEDAHTLPCSHRFCLECITGCFRSSKRQECPLCKVGNLQLSAAVLGKKMPFGTKRARQTRFVFVFGVWW